MASLKRMRPLLGTFVEIGCEQSDKSAEHAITAAFDIIEKLHHLLSFHEQTSDLTRLNQADGKAIEVHQHTIRVMKLARAMTVASNGFFNCTLGGAMVQSGVLPNHNNPDPNASAIKSSGVASDIQINGNTIQLSNSIKITLDGIAKGYAVDCAIAIMKRHGIKTAWVNAGGDLRVYGDLVLPIQRREMNRRSIQSLSEAIRLTGLRAIQRDPAILLPHEMKGREIGQRSPKDRRVLRVQRPANPECSQRRAQIQPRSAQNFLTIEVDAEAR